MLKTNTLKDKAKLVIKTSITLKWNLCSSENKQVLLAVGGKGLSRKETQGLGLYKFVFNFNNTEENKKKWEKE